MTALVPAFPRFRLPEPAALWTERRARLNAFERGAYNILTLALTDDLSLTNTLSRAECAIRTALSPEAKAEMVLYAIEISITVTGRQWNTGWPFCKKTPHKYLNAEIIFEPYKMSLSVWKHGDDAPIYFTG